jgi:hypothetical protein
LHCGSQPEADSQWARNLGFKVNTAADKYLGGFIAGTLRQRQDLAMRKAEAIATDLRKLDSPHIPVQIALVVAFSCVPDRFAYLARLNTPQVLRQAAAYLDGQLLSFYCRRTGISEAELTPAMRQQLYMPRRLGGRGLRSCEALLERAYLGAQALSAPHLQSLLAAEPPGADRFEATRQSLEEVKSTISEELAKELLPVAAEGFITHYSQPSKERRKQAGQLQQCLTTGAALHEDAKRAEELARTGTVQEKALRHANRAPGASLVFTTLPNRAGLAMSNGEVEINERVHLGLKPNRDMPLHCHCNHANGQFGFDSWHAFSCLLAKGGTITGRHDDIKYGLAHWVTRLGGRVRVEPRADGHHPAAEEHGPAGRRHRGRWGRQRPPPAAPPDGRERKEEAKEGKEGRPGRKRFDLFIWGLGRPIAVDVTVRHSLAPSHVQACARDEEAVLREAEAEKERDYRGLADQIGADFYAFAVETTGRLGPGALAFIRRLIQEGARFKNVDAPKEVVNGIYRSVAVALARGNADIVQANLTRSRLAEW